MLSKIHDGAVLKQQDKTLLFDTDKQIIFLIYNSNPLDHYAVINICTYFVSAHSSLISFLAHLQQWHKSVDGSVFQEVMDFSLCSFWKQLLDELAWLFNRNRDGNNYDFEFYKCTYT